jgi:NAD(P)-dependent dehydrogenase (short-subunit alcohol dehydrogenase family)
MLSSFAVKDADRFAAPLLVDAKVLVSGFDPDVSRALAIAFAEAGAQVRVQAPAQSPGVGAFAAYVAETGADVAIDVIPSASAAAAARFARDAARTPGGLDIVVILSSLDAEARAHAVASGDADDAVRDLLLPVALVSNVAANRMRVILKEGAILAVALLPPAATTADAAFESYARAALAALTRIESRTWAPHGVALNAIVCSSGDCSPEDIAAVALRLARCDGRRLTGFVLDAAGAADLSC